MGLQQGSRNKTSNAESPQCPEAEFKPLLSPEGSCSLSGKAARHPVPHLASRANASSSTRDPAFLLAPLHHL